MVTAVNSVPYINVVPSVEGLVGPDCYSWPRVWLSSKSSKDAHFSNAVAAFANTEDRPHLGAALGTPDYIRHYVTTKVSECSEELAPLRLYSIHTWHDQQVALPILCHSGYQSPPIGRDH